jgi:hypothetical protein
VRSFTGLSPTTPATLLPTTTTFLWLFGQRVGRSVDGCFSEPQASSGLRLVHGPIWHLPHTLLYSRSPFGKVEPGGGGVRTTGGLRPSPRTFLGSAVVVRFDRSAILALCLLLPIAFVSCSRSSLQLLLQFFFVF